MSSPDTTRNYEEREYKSDSPHKDVPSNAKHTALKKKIGKSQRNLNLQDFNRGIVRDYKGKKRTL